MRTNQVKQAIQAGQVSLGTFIFEFSTTGIGRIAAEAGAEFLIFDMEHTGWSVETIRMLIASSRSTDAVPIVRVPATQYHFMARVLDMGAMGIMLPMVESVEQAQLIVDSCKYPPMGRRGAAFTISHDDYTGGDVATKIREANEHTLLIAQIETARGLDEVERIAQVDGIDVLWIGQYDLSSSLGIPGQFEHPDFVSAIGRVIAAANAHGKVAGFMPLSVEESRLRINQGFRCLAYGGDLWLYQKTLADGLKEIRASI
ncbi:MAG: aldolase/citrate lyase family protein [Planctomycetota bacterium]|nr:aldolase/citrate lyase family protein [Planctomycetota bacterium]